MLALCLCCGFPLAYALVLGLWAYARQFQRVTVSTHAANRSHPPPVLMPSRFLPLLAGFPISQNKTAERIATLCRSNLSQCTPLRSRVLDHAHHLHGRPFPAPRRGNSTLIQSLCDLPQAHGTLCPDCINHRKQISRTALCLLTAYLC